MRRLLPPVEARRAIDQLVNRFRRGAVPTAAEETTREGGDPAGGRRERKKQTPGTS